MKLIPEFDGSPTGLSTVEQFENAECFCKLFRIKEPTWVTQLKLTGGEGVLCSLPATQQ